MNDKKITITVDIDLPDDDIDELEKNIDESNEDYPYKLAGYELLSEMIFSGDVDQVIDAEEVDIKTEIGESQDK